MSTNDIPIESILKHVLRAYAEIDLKKDKRKRERLLNNIKKIEDHLEKIGFTETSPFFHIKIKPKK